MCNWNTYTYDCGCLKVRMRDRCQNKRVDDEMDPCFRMQCVREDWRFHQNEVCEDCRRKGLGQARVQDQGQDQGQGQDQSGLVGKMPWSEVDTKAHAEALRLARNRSSET